MVTARQFTRGVVRTMRAIDREAKRAEKRRLAAEKAAQRLAALEAASDAAEQYTNFVNSLTGAHRITFNRFDWFTPAARDLVPDPQYSSKHEATAVEKLAHYQPGWAARTFGLAKGQRAKLAANIHDAKTRDVAEHEKKLSQVREANAHTELARGVVAIEQSAVERALAEYSQLGNLPFSVEGVDLMFFENRRVVVVVDGLDQEDMPEQSVSLLQSGKASIKAIPKSKVMELHRDTICSSAIRVGLECLQALPIDAVEVVMQTDVLDGSTGHIRSEPVLFIRIAAQAIDVINLSRVEAPALIERLGGHLNWSKRDGFKPINLAAFNVELGEA